MRAACIATILFSLFVPLAISQDTVTLSNAIAFADIAVPDRDDADRASFLVINRSAKPVLAWGADITWVFADGTTKVTRYVADYAPTVSHVGRFAAGSRRVHVGELDSRDQAEVRIALARQRSALAASEQPPVSAALVATFVIFSDNDFVGNEKLVGDVFLRWKAMGKAYAQQLPLAKQLEGTSEIRAAVQKTLIDLRRIRENSRGIGTPIERLAHDIVYSEIEMELENVTRCIARQQKPPAGCAADYVRRVETSASVFAAHAEQLGGRR